MSHTTFFLTLAQAAVLLATLWYMARRVGRMEKSGVKAALILLLLGSVIGLGRGALTPGFLWALWAVYKSSLGDEFGDYTLIMYRYAKNYYRKVKDEL